MAKIHHFLIKHLMYYYLKKIGIKKPSFLYPLMFRQGLTNIDFIKSLPYRILKITNKDRKVHKTSVIFNHEMYLDNKDSLNLAWYRIYDPFETHLMTSLIKPGDVVADLGANIGYYTLIFSKLVGNNGKIFAFEPGSSNFNILIKNIKINGYSKIVVTEKKAISNIDDKEIILYLDDDNHGMNRIYKANDLVNEKYKQEVVKTIRLDTYFENNYDCQKIDFIKMDLEGSEYGALTGMQNISRNPLNKNLKMLVEFHPTSIIEYGKEPKQVLELLYSYNFDIWDLDKIKKNKTKISLNNESILNEFIRKADKYTTNLLCEKQI